MRGSRHGQAPRLAEGQRAALGPVGEMMRQVWYMVLREGLWDRDLGSVTGQQGTAAQAPGCRGACGQGRTGPGSRTTKSRA